VSFAVMPSVPSFGAPTHTPSKNRATGVALALGGCQSIKIPNNQLTVGGSDRMKVVKEVCGGRAYEKTFSPCFSRQIERHKNNKKKTHLALYGHQLAMAYTTTNQKQTSMMKKIMKRMYNQAGTRWGCSVLHRILRARTSKRIDKTKVNC
jgi:hypothetical protein